MYAEPWYRIIQSKIPTKSFSRSLCGSRDGGFTSKKIWHRDKAHHSIRIRQICRLCFFLITCVDDQVGSDETALTHDPPVDRQPVSFKFRQPAGEIIHIAIEPPRKR